MAIAGLPGGVAGISAGAACFICNDGGRLKRPLLEASSSLLTFFSRIDTRSSRLSDSAVSDGFAESNVASSRDPLAVGGGGIYSPRRRSFSERTQRMKRSCVGPVSGVSF